MLKDIHAKLLKSLSITNAKVNIPMDWRSLLTKPPANDSSITKQELQQVKKISSERTESDLILIKRTDEDPSITLKDILKKNNLTFPKEEFDRLYRTLEPIILYLKEYYARARPYTIDPTINAIDSKTHENYLSYPSGHVAYAALSEKILSEKYPQHKDEFKKAVDDVGRARILMGVHYASDNTASIKLVDKLWPYLRKETK